MRFLVDEDVPAKLLNTLLKLGHDAVRVKPGTPDTENVKRAKSEARVFITLDKDFINPAVYPAAEFDIIRLQIHPPYANALVSAFQKLLTTVPVEKFKGLIVLQEGGHIRVT